MTPAEKKQPFSVFLDAGKHAYQINVLSQFNPYTEEPFRSLWDKGYKKAKMQHEESFVRAGRIAYASGQDLKENPNKVPNQRALWERGFKLAQAASDRQAAIARGEYVPPSIRKPFVKPAVRSTSNLASTRPPVNRKPFSKTVKTFAVGPVNTAVTVSIPTKGYRSGTIGDYVAGTINSKEIR